MVDVFNVQIFFIVFRESLKLSLLFQCFWHSLSNLWVVVPTSIEKTIVSSDLARAGLGVLVCLIIGCAFIGAFYGLGKDIWGNSEDLWEGIFCIIATVLITAMGIPMLRINKMKENGESN